MRLQLQMQNLVDPCAVDGRDETTIWIHLDFKLLLQPARKTEKIYDILCCWALLASRGV